MSVHSRPSTQYRMKWVQRAGIVVNDCKQTLRIGRITCAVDVLGPPHCTTTRTLIIKVNLCLIQNNYMEGLGSATIK